MPEWAMNPTFLAIVVIAALGAFWKLASWYGGVNSDRDSFKQLMADVGTDLKAIRADIQKIFHLLPRPVVEGQSPVQLTEYGERISATVDAVAWAEKQARGLVRDAAGKEEFDLCVAHVSAAYETDPEFRRAVRSGAYQLGTDDENVLKVYQVVLRDHVLDLIPH